jgi:hypothetical protein
MGAAARQPTGEVVAVVARGAGDIVACLAEPDERALTADASGGAGRLVRLWPGRKSGGFTGRPNKRRARRNRSSLAAPGGACLCAQGKWRMVCQRHLLCFGAWWLPQDEAAARAAERTASTTVAVHIELCFKLEAIAGAVPLNIKCAWKLLST